MDARVGRVAVIALLDLHGSGMPEGVEYIGRAGRSGVPARSPLSNPFGVDKHGIDAALRLYRIHLAGALASADPVIIRELARLGQLADAGGLTLGCWCATRQAHIEGRGGAEPSARCHGDIVATVLVHWGVRLSTHARARSSSDTAGPERWAAWVARDLGAHAQAVLASCFGFAEVGRMASDSPAIAAGMPDWLHR